MSTDVFTLTKLQNQVKSLINENNAYKLYITKLEKAFIKLENDYSSIKYQYQLIKSKELHFDKIKPELELKNKIISNLENELLIQKAQYQKYINKKEREYEQDMDEARRLGEMSKTKIQNSENIEKLNDLFYYKNKELENEIIKIKEEEKIKMIEKEKDFEERLKDMKVKMLDFIKEAQKGIKEEENKKLNEKISIIHKNSLLNELEFQSLQLEDLLKQREHLDKIIDEMKSDIEIHKKVEKILVGKNKKYTDMIRHLSVKMDKIEANEGKNIDNNKFNSNLLSSKSNNDIIEDFSTSKTSKYFNSPKNLFFAKINRVKNKEVNFDMLINRTNIHVNDNLIPKDDKLLFNKRKNNFFNANKKNSSMDNLSEFKPCEIRIKNKLNENIDKITLQRELIKKLKVLEDYKSKYESYKAKLEYIKNKYMNIIKLFDEALEKMYDENKIKMNEICIDVEKLKKCDFEKLSPEQKYAIATLLIKYLLPLINKDNLPENLKNKLKSMHTKFFFNEYNDSVFNSVFNSNSLSTTINGKRYNNSNTPTVKKIIEYLGENSYSYEKNNKSKNTKKLIHNLNLDRYHCNSYSSGYSSGFNLSKFSPNKNINFKKILNENFPNIKNFPDIPKPYSVLKI